MPQTLISVGSSISFVVVWEEEEDDTKSTTKRSQIISDTGFRKECCLTTIRLTNNPAVASARRDITPQMRDSRISRLTRMIGMTAKRCKSDQHTFSFRHTSHELQATHGFSISNVSFVAFMHQILNQL